MLRWLRTSCTNATKSYDSSSTYTRTHACTRTRTRVLHPLYTKLSACRVCACVFVGCFRHASCAAPQSTSLRVSEPNTIRKLAAARQSSKLNELRCVAQAQATGSCTPGGAKASSSSAAAHLLQQRWRRAKCSASLASAPSALCVFAFVPDGKQIAPPS